MEGMTNQSTKAAIYEVGYRGMKNERDLKLAAARVANSIVVDVRISPGRPFIPFNSSRLRDLLGDGYLWVRDLGNLNYRSYDEPKKIADLESGITQVLAQIEAGRTPILMCACGDFHECHRRDVALALLERLPDAAIVPLPWGPKTLFDDAPPSCAPVSPE